MSQEESTDAATDSLQGAGGSIGGSADRTSFTDPFISSTLDDKTDLRRRRNDKYRECRQREIEWGELHSSSGVNSDSLDAGTELKERGNAVYAKGDYQGALALYWEALEVLPWITPPSISLSASCEGSGNKELNSNGGGVETHVTESSINLSPPPASLTPVHTLRSVCHCNRAACFATQEKWEDALWDCDRALEINPSYTKALARRGAVLEKLDLLDDALTDYKVLIALDPGKASSGAKKDEERVLKLIQARDEKLKVSARKGGKTGGGGASYVFFIPLLTFFITHPFNARRMT
jgi:tetratricopeptide (TPR) repeat protein